MKIATFAPHLAGRMLPAMFDYLGISKVERFPGDPYAHQEPWAAWIWMHTTECGSPNHIGSSKSWTIPAALRELRAAAAPAQTPTPPARVRTAQIDLFQGIAA